MIPNSLIVIKLYVCVCVLGMAILMLNSNFIVCCQLLFSQLKKYTVKKCSQGIELSSETAMRMVQKKKAMATVSQEPSMKLKIIVLNTLD